MNAPSQVRRWQAWQTSASRTHARASAPPPAVNCSPKLSRSRMAKIGLPGLPTSDRPCQKPWSDLLFFELEGLTRSDQAVQAAFVPHMVDARRNPWRLHAVQASDVPAARLGALAAQASRGAGPVLRDRGVEAARRGGQAARRIPLHRARLSDARPWLRRQADRGAHHPATARLGSPRERTHVLPDLRQPMARREGWRSRVGGRQSLQPVRAVYRGVGPRSYPQNWEKLFCMCNARGGCSPRISSLVLKEVRLRAPANGPKDCRPPLLWLHSRECKTRHYLEFACQPSLLRRGTLSLCY
jgi:hypothetical protein